MIRVKIPATSANMGAGFDTLGVALSLYNVLEISETGGGLDVVSLRASGYIPRDENNLIYRAMNQVFDKVGYHPAGLRIQQRSQIPMTRGLGSSSACIIGGMLAANILSGRRLSYPQILDLAAQMEGHPDNVAPALYGGFCVSVMDGDRTLCKSTKIDPHIRFAVMVPDYFVATKKSRTSLPELVSHKDAAFNVAHASLFTAAMMSGDTSMLRAGAEDRLHQQYRKGYIEGMDEIFEKTYGLGACATYLSGSGPTVLSILDHDYMRFNRSMQAFFKENSQRWTCRILSVDNVGAVVRTFG